MKLKLITIILSLLFATSCNKDEQEQIDPIVGTWFLVDQIIDGNKVEMTDCSIQSNLIFTADEKVTFNSYVIQDGVGTCEFQTWNESWGSGANGTYGVFSGSLFNQERSFQITGSQLKYFLESWEFVDGTIITSDMVFVYEKR